MAKGKLKNPHWVNAQCQYCDKEFQYYRETSSTRKACFDCIPEGKGKDAALIRRLIKNKAIMSKGSRCYCCKNTFPNSVYDFHHLNPAEKDFALGDKTSTTKWALIEKELEKCILVCANCHRMIHSGDLVLENIGNDVE